MTNELNLFTYTFINNKAIKTLFLLHGTGGTKEDFFFLNALLEKRYNLVGIQGNVNENGLTRFFKRFPDGTFDQESIKAETLNLQLFITAFADTYPQLSTDISFLGYSNGANMILATLLSYPRLINKAVLLHGMLPFEVSDNQLNLSKHQLFVSHGHDDPFFSCIERLFLEFSSGYYIPGSYEYKNATTSSTSCFVI